MKYRDREGSDDVSWRDPRPPETDYVRDLRRRLAQGGEDEPKSEPAPEAPKPGAFTKETQPKVRGNPFVTDPAHTARCLKGRYARAKEGRFVSGACPFGYHRKSRREGRDLIPKEPEASFIRALFTRYWTEHTSVKKLTEWAAECMPQYKWSCAKVGYILRNPVYRGSIRFGTHRGPGEHEPLVSAIVFNKVQKKLDAQNKRVRSDNGQEGA